MTARFSSGEKKFYCYPNAEIGIGGRFYLTKNDGSVDIFDFENPERDEPIEIAIKSDGTSEYTQVRFQPREQSHETTGWNISLGSSIIGMEPECLILDKELFAKYPSGASFVPNEFDTLEGLCQVFIKTGIYSSGNPSAWGKLTFPNSGIKIGNGVNYARSASITVKEGEKIIIWARGDSEDRDQGIYGEGVDGFYDADGNLIKYGDTINWGNYEFTAKGATMTIYVGYSYFNR